MALTAAVMSGGTFVGFPSLVYSFGWVVGLWIASYMVAPLTVLGVAGQADRPALAEDRGDHPARPLPRAVRQPGARAADEPARHVLPDLQPRPPVHGGRADHEDRAPVGGRELGRQRRDRGVTPTRRYLLGLAIFTATVVAYTTYGGFLAAIWTDVFQSIIMAIGVMLLFPLAMAASGGLAKATLAGMAQTDPGFAFGPGAGRAFHPIGAGALVLRHVGDHRHGAAVDAGPADGLPRLADASLLDHLSDDL